MAELTTAETTADACCAPEQQATCCEPSDKAECCGHEAGCGCDADAADIRETVREQVRERYALSAARLTLRGDPQG